MMMSPTNFIESLPDDVLEKIFVDHLSVEDICESARLVCRKWYRITNTDSFVHSHPRRTERVLLFQKRFRDDDTLSLSLRHGRVEISTLRHTFRGPFCRLRNQGGTVYITNPLTNRRVALPPIRGITSWRYCIANAEASMVNKVVVISRPGPPDTNEVVDYCRILTVGVDNSWRSVPVAHLSHKDKITFFVVPLATEGGFLHWCGESGNRVLTMDVEAEIIKETPLPFPEVGAQRRAYLSTGKCLSLLVRRGDYLWQVWELKPQTGEWRMVTDFSLEACKCVFERICFREYKNIAPLGWLMYPQVLVFGFSNGKQLWVFPYNLVTREIESIELPQPTEYNWCFLHKSSLVP